MRRLVDVALGIGGSEDMTERVRARREQLLAEDGGMSGEQVQAETIAQARVQTTRQKASGTASERIRALRDRAED